jgi:hypothetical protein
MSNAQSKLKIEEKLFQPHRVIHPQIKENAFYASVQEEDI